MCSCVRMYGKFTFVELVVGWTRINNHATLRMYLHKRHGSLWTRNGHSLNMEKISMDIFYLISPCLCLHEETVHVWVSCESIPNEYYIVLYTLHSTQSIHVLLTYTGRQKKSVSSIYLWSMNYSSSDIAHERSLLSSLFIILTYKTQRISGHKPHSSTMYTHIVSIIMVESSMQMPII